MHNNNIAGYVFLFLPATTLIDARFSDKLPAKFAMNHAFKADKSTDTEGMATKLNPRILRKRASEEEREFAPLLKLFSPLSSVTFRRSKCEDGRVREFVSAVRHGSFVGEV